MTRLEREFVDIVKPSLERGLQIIRDRNKGIPPRMLMIVISNCLTKLLESVGLKWKDIHFE